MDLGQTILREILGAIVERRSVDHEKLSGDALGDALGEVVVAARHHPARVRLGVLQLRLLVTIIILPRRKKDETNEEKMRWGKREYRGYRG